MLYRAATQEDIDLLVFMRMIFLEIEENNPEYDSRNDFERAEDAATLHIAYKECSNNWSDKKILVYTETLKGKSKKEIARELGMTYQGTKNILDKIIADLRKELVKERI